MAVFTSLLLFVLGASVASFSGLVGGILSRHATAEARWSALSRARSRCDGCEVPLSAPSLAPVIGWLAAKGRCSHCGHRVALAYPLSELATGGGAVGLLFLNRGGAGELAALLVLLLSGVLAAWIETAQGRASYWLAALLLGLGLHLSPFAPDPSGRLAAALLAAAGAALVARLLRRWLRAPPLALALNAAAGAGWVGLDALPAYAALWLLLTLLAAASRGLAPRLPVATLPATLAALVLALWSSG